VGQGLAGTCLAWRLWQSGNQNWCLTDRKERSGCSDVAAGTMNPIAGKGWNPGWRIEEALSNAVTFYRELEEILNCQLYRDLVIERRISSTQELEKVRGKKELLEPWLIRLSEDAAMVKGGRLFTTAFLNASRDFFEKEGLFRIDADEYDQTVWATGAVGLIKEGLKHRSAKGQIILVKADSAIDHMIVESGKWVIPNGDGEYCVGATYEWDQLDNEPTGEGKDSLLTVAKKLLGENVVLIDHVAGVRPILRQSQPVVGQIPGRDGDYIFNGLGSKGSIYAPLAAKTLTEHFVNGVKIPDDLDFLRYLGISVNLRT